MDEWRPIATAPKDETFIDVSDKYGNRTTDVKWDGRRGDWVSWLGHWDQQWLPVDPPPSHWMPLPPPPGDGR